MMAIRPRPAQHLLANTAIIMWHAVYLFDVIEVGHMKFGSGRMKFYPMYQATPSLYTGTLLAAPPV